MRKGPENTGLGGSSLGGLITLYTQFAMPGVFGRLLIESPSLFVANGKFWKRTANSAVGPSASILAMGTREVGHEEKDAKIIDDVRELEYMLHARLGWAKID